MGRPRVILASSDAEAAVRMIAALNPRRYRVEHIFDINEALLRAKIVLAHALVVHGDLSDDALLRNLRQVAQRVTPVFVSGSVAINALAEDLDARYVPEPLDVATFKRAVYRAVSRTQDRRHRTRAKQPGERVLQRVLLLHANQVEAAVMAAVLRNQLDATCEVATTAEDALVLFDDGSGAVECVIADPALLMGTHEGAVIAQRLANAGVPVVPLNHVGELDVSSAGQVAWDIAPQVRRSLTARNRNRMRAAV